jgi:hypothetical protein
MIHECTPGIERAYRLMLALLSHDEDARRLIMAEINDCPPCLTAVLRIALDQWAGAVVLHTGGPDPAADLMANELVRVAMG